MDEIDEEVVYVDPKSPNDYDAGEGDAKGATNFFRTFSRLPPITKKVFKNDFVPKA